MHAFLVTKTCSIQSHITSSDPPVIMRSRANDAGGVAAAIRAGSPVNVSQIYIISTIPSTVQDLNTKIHSGF